MLLTMTVTAFASPSLEFGPLVLARPLWALLLLHSWQLIGQKRHNAWFAWSIEAGLLLLTTPAAIGLLLLIAGFALATSRGRRTLMSFDPLFALLVIVVLALPYLIWLIRADAIGVAAIAGDRAAERAGAALGRLARRPAAGDVRRHPARDPQLALVRRKPEEAPIIYRPPVDPLAREFVYFFAIAPALAGSLIAGLFNLDGVAGGAGIALLMSGLAVDRRDRRSRPSPAPAAAALGLGGRDRRRRPLAAIAATLFLPWTECGEVATSLPATAIARFFGDSFERRTNQQLRAVAGDPQLASLIALESARPHLLLEATPQRTPWLTPAKFLETGGIVVWRASDTSGTPPADIAQRFPGLVPEVPRAFEWLVNGRQPLLRIGWAIVRPKGP